MFCARSSCYGLWIGDSMFYQMKSMQIPSLGNSNVLLLISAYQFRGTCVTSTSKLKSTHPDAGHSLVYSVSGVMACRQYFKRPEGLSRVAGCYSGRYTTHRQIIYSIQLMGHMDTIVDMSQMIGLCGSPQERVVFCCCWDIRGCCFCRVSVDEFVSLEKVASNAVKENLLSAELVAELVHTAYGMSKDFGMNGFRVGCLHTKSKDLLEASIIF